MFVLGFNLPFGKKVVRPDGKEERPRYVVGLGLAWSRGDFARVMKGTDPQKERQPKRDA